MSTTLNKLEYLDETKSQIKTALNQFGSGITDSDTFRSYVSKINDIYDNWEKVTGEGTDITLNNTKASKLALSPKGNITQAILPEAYQQVEYIESSGGQYIDTGVKGNNNTRADISFRTKTVGNSQAVFGYYVGGYNKTLFLYSSGDKHFQVGYGAFKNLSDRWVDNTKYEISLSNGKIIINGTETTITKASDFTTDENLLLFKISGSTGGGMPIQLYNFKIYNGDTLVRNFIPCYKISNNEIGLYDIVNNVFYTNAGTGTFTKGADAPTPNAEIPVKVIDGEYEVTVSNSDNTQSQTETIDTSPNPLYSENDYYYKQNGNWYVHNEWAEFDLTNRTWEKQTNKNRFYIQDYKTIVKKPSASNVLANCNSNIFKIITASQTYLQKNGLAIDIKGVIYIYYNDYESYTEEQFATLMNNKNAYLIAELESPTNTPITNTTLINQLETLQNMLAYQDQTNISQTHNITQADIIISASALKKGGNI